MITERLYSVHGRWQLLSKRCPFLATLRTRKLAPKKFSFNFLQHLLIKFSLRCFSHVILGGEGCFCVVEGGEKGFKFFLTEYFFKPMCCAWYFCKIAIKYLFNFNFSLITPDMYLHPRTTAISQTRPWFVARILKHLRAVLILRALIESDMGKHDTK